MARRDIDDDDSDAKAASAPSDAYVGLLGIGVFALLVAAVLMYLDTEALQSGTPKASDPTVRLAEGGLNKLAPPPGAGAPKQ